MPASLTIKPSHKAIQSYYAALKDYSDQGIEHETALRSAFQNLLADTGKAHGWTLVPELSLKVGGKTVRPDGTLRDEYYLPRGYWEAKDTADRLDDEIRKKSAKGYPLTNTIFEDTRQAVLYQNGGEVFRADLSNPQQVADLLNQFYSYTEPDIESFEQAISEFAERVPELAKGVDEKIKAAHKSNTRFQDAYASFFDLCQTSLNPNISKAAVDEMLVQHLLTERLFRRIFDNPEFTRRNVIAAEVERVIDALVSQSFNRDDYLKSLDRFYRAIEDAARGLEDFSEKQHFLNSVYERFFQGYSVKVADTHGIVYTPQPIVDFMCASVVEVLQREFDKSLGDDDVVILDPCTGTGNFIVNLLRRMPGGDLQAAYRDRLYANEIMLLPYYIASMNIEHAYYELNGAYEPCEGLCFVDTLDIADTRQLSLFAEVNAARVKKQRRAPITVIIGNPPYNIRQQNENDNNKNRQYSVVDNRIRETYAKDSTATNKSAISDAYLKFFRWATDRLQGRDGIVCFVTNNGFIHNASFDGFRKHILQDFDLIYHFDLKGNANSSGERRRREGGNIFSDQIKVGVGITLLIRNNKGLPAEVRYHAVPDYWKSDQKKEYLNSFSDVSAVAWEKLTPDSQHNWVAIDNTSEFASFLPIASKTARSAKGANGDTIFKRYSFGINTARDTIVYDFDRRALAERVQQFIEDYNGEVDRYKRSGKGANVDNFVRYDKVKWSRDLKLDLQRGKYAEFDEAKIRTALYRPFCKQHLFFDRILNEEVYSFPHIFPTPATENENRIIWLKVGPDWPVFGLMSRWIAGLMPQGGAQCFPYYIYDEDGSNRRENITDWALAQFRAHYADDTISKWDIFYYVYGMLHHPGYREKFADNLKRELPRIPYTPDFRAFVTAGKALADLHVNYESAAPYQLRQIVAKDKPLSYRVEKMRLNKDKTALTVNNALALADIPPEAHQYRLGNRSALEWVIDQYQVSTDKRSGVTSDPNRADDPRYIVDLVGRVITVSVETVKIVAGLPEAYR